MKSPSASNSKFLFDSTEAGHHRTADLNEIDYE
jgi:hypothetical protein